MSQSNVEIVRWLIDSNQSEHLEGRLDQVLEVFAVDCEYVSVLGTVDQEIYRGHEGLRRYARDMLAAWSEWRNELGEIVEVSPGTVLVTFRTILSGRQSGVPLENEGAAVFWLTEGKVTRAQTFADRAGALEAAGAA